MKITKHHNVAAAVAAIALSLGVAQATAAAAPDAVPPAGAPGAEAGQQPAEVSDQKLRQFATAAAGVQKIQQDYAAKAQTLQKNTEERIISSVEDAGMTVAEFTALVARVQSDPDLARRLDDLQRQ